MQIYNEQLNDNSMNKTETLSNENMNSNQNKYYSLGWPFFKKIFVVFVTLSTIFIAIFICFNYFKKESSIKIEFENLYEVNENDFQKSIHSILKNNGIIQETPSIKMESNFETAKRNTNENLENSQALANFFHQRVLSYVNQTHVAISLSSDRSFSKNEFRFQLYRDNVPQDLKHNLFVQMTNFESEFFICEKTGDHYGIYIYQFLIEVHGLSLDLEKNLNLKGKYEISVSVGYDHSIRFTLPTTFIENPNQEFVILSYGDMDVNYNSRATVLNLATMLKPSTKMIIHQGDIPYAWDSSQRKWESWADQVQPLTTHLFYQVGPGNHEKSAYCDFQSYEKRFSKWAGINSQSNTNLYYSFEYLGIHWISISSEHDYTPGSKQYQWIVNDLNKVNRNKTPFVIAYAHRPMYSSNINHGSDDNLRIHIGPILEKYNVDLALFGHVHAYERAQPFENGTIYVEVGTAGYESNPYWEIDVPKWSKYRETAHGFLKLTIVPSKSIKSEFYRNYFERGEPIPSVSDKFTIPVKAYLQKEENYFLYGIHLVFIAVFIIALTLFSLLMFIFFILIILYRKKDNLDYVIQQEFQELKMDEEFEL